MSLRKIAFVCKTFTHVKSVFFTDKTFAVCIPLMKNTTNMYVSINSLKQSVSRQMLKRNVFIEFFFQGENLIEIVLMEDGQLQKCF